MDRGRFSALIYSANRLLTWTSLFTACVVTPILAWMLHERAANAPTIAAIVLLVAGPQWIATRTTVLATVSRLNSHLRQLQVAEIVAACIRTAITLGAAALGFINIHTALLAVTVATLVYAVLIRRQVLPMLDANVNGAEEAEFGRGIRTVMRQMYPNNVFHCVQSQLAMGLLSVLGGTSEVADLGALSRLSFFANLIAAPLNYIIGPAFARCSDGLRLTWLFSWVLGVYVSILAVFIGLVAWQADTVLLLLGPKYSHLHIELILVATAIAIVFVSQIFWSLNFSRGWVQVVWLNIPMVLSAQFASALLLDVTTVRGAVLLNMVTALPTLLLGVGVAVTGLRRLCRVSPGEH